MSTFSVTANSDSTLKTGWYGYSSYRTTSVSAFQGHYNGSDTTMPYPRVGLIHFSGAGSALKNKNISSITLTTTAGGSGYGSSSYKTLYIRKSNYQSINTSIACASYVGDLMGTLYGIFYSNTNTFTLNSSSNSDLFAALKSYFEAGNSQICIYTPETTSATYSTNFLSLTSVSITVTYTEGGCVRIWDGTQWAKYIPYIWDGSQWVRYSPYIWDGTQWVLYGG